MNEKRTSIKQRKYSKMIVKKNIFIFMCLALLFSPIMTALNGFAGKVYAEGFTTIIMSIDELNEIRNNLDGNYTLGADINLTKVENWHPIGSVEQPFNGHFNGNGFKVTGMDSVYEQDKYGGLFTNVSTNANIEQLHVEYRDVIETDDMKELQQTDLENDHLVIHHVNDEGELTENNHSESENINTEDDHVNNFDTTTASPFAMIMSNDEADFEWEVNPDNNTTVRITGYIGTSTDITIPDTLDGKAVTQISTNAFSEKGLTSVVIPDSVISIGINAFGYNHLTTVTIPNSVEIINAFAFRNNQLNQIVLGNSVKEIRTGAFEFNKLTEINFPNSLETIGAYAFSDNDLTQLIIPDSVTSIGGFAFLYNKLTTAKLSENLTEISSALFQGNRLTEIEIPQSVTIIHSNAFFDNNITDIVIPEGVKTIGHYAFDRSIYLNKMGSLVIPKSVEEIGDTTFSGVFDTITVHPDNLYFSDQNNKGLFNKDGTKMYLATVSGAENIPAGIEHIPSYAFMGAGLTSIQLPDTVKTIGSMAFADNNLTEITIGENIEDIGTEAFFNNPFDKIIVHQNNPYYSDQGETGLYSKDGAILYYGTTTGQIADDTKIIHFAAFYNLGLTNIVIPNSVEYLLEAAFSSNNISHVYIGSGIKPFENSGDTWHELGIAFHDNPIVQIKVDSENPWYKDVDGQAVYTKDGKILVFGTPLSSIADGTEEIYFEALHGSDTETLDIPASVKSLMDYSIGYTKNVKNIIIRNKDLPFNSSDEWPQIYFIDADETDPIGDVTIWGYAGSTAETFADDFGYTFKTLQDIESVENPSSIEVDYGTDRTQLNLPEKVIVTLSNNDTEEIDVIWDTSSYNGSSAGTYTFQGELINLPFGIINVNSLSAEIQITIKEEDDVIVEDEDTDKKDNTVEENDSDHEQINIIVTTNNESNGDGAVISEVDANKLPKTATHTFNIMLAGLLLTIIGGFILILARNKRIS